MQFLRSFFHSHRALAIVMVVAAICMKAVLPAGYMIGRESRVLTVQLCQDASGNDMVTQIVVPMKSDTGDSGGKHGKAASACPYSALSMASLSGADAALLAIALAFILTLSLAPAQPAPLQRSSHLRPPLRGPPALV